MVHGDEVEVGNQSKMEAWEYKWEAADGAKEREQLAEWTSNYEADNLSVHEQMDGTNFTRWMGAETVEEDRAEGDIGVEGDGLRETEEEVDTEEWHDTNNAEVTIDEEEDEEAALEEQQQQAMEDDTAQTQLGGYSNGGASTASAGPTNSDMMRVMQEMQQMKAAFGAQVSNLKQQLAAAQAEKAQAEREKEAAVALTSMSWPKPGKIADKPSAAAPVGNQGGGGDVSPIIVTTVVEHAGNETVDETHPSSASDPLTGAQSGLAKMPTAPPQNGMGQEGEAAAGSDRMSGRARPNPPL